MFSFETTHYLAYIRVIKIIALPYPIQPCGLKGVCLVIPSLRFPHSAPGFLGDAPHRALKSEAKRLVSPEVSATNLRMAYSAFYAKNSWFLRRPVTTVGPVSPPRPGSECKKDAANERRLRIN